MSKCVNYGPGVVMRKIICPGKTEEQRAATQNALTLLFQNPKYGIQLLIGMDKNDAIGNSVLAP